MIFARLAAVSIALLAALTVTAQADPITGLIFGAAFAASIPGMIVSLGVTATSCYVVLAAGRRPGGKK